MITNTLKKNTLNTLPETVLDFWFAEENQVNWFSGDSNFDTEIRDKFFNLHNELIIGHYEKWLESRLGRLAYVIVLDQFSRNLYRNNAKAFKYDLRALKIANLALQHGDDLWLKNNKDANWRVFLYLPFMHSENLEDQKRCLYLFLTHGPVENVQYAREHLDVIYRFGRFPKRNKALNRVSTLEELDFLESSDYSW